MEQSLTDIRKILKDYFGNKQKKFVPGKTKVGVGSPIYDDKEVIAVLGSLLEGNISQGKAVKTFERSFADYVGVGHAVAVNSGSSANLIALTTFIESGEVKQGDEIIIPAATFSTVAFPAMQLGLTPVFVDVERDSYNINPSEVKSAISSKTKILMPVHSLGNPADMEKIKEVADSSNLKILEDCCEAHGASINGKKVCSYGDMATISFYVAHNITCGEGGMIFTDSDDYERLLVSIREFGRTEQEGERFKEVENLGVYDKRYIFDRMGYNLRMTDLQASFGIEQLRKLEDLNKKRIDNVGSFTKALTPYQDFIQLPAVRKGTVHTFYGFPVVVKENAPFKRQDMVEYLEGCLIETRPFFAGCLPDQPAFRNKRIRVHGNLTVSRWLRDNAFFIGCHADIGNEERNYVIEKIINFFKRF